MNKVFRKIESFIRNPGQNNNSRGVLGKEKIERRVEEATQRAMKDYDKTFKILTEYDK